MSELVRIDGALVPANRIGEPGLYRGPAGEYVKKFRDGPLSVPFIHTSITATGRYPAHTEFNVNYIIMFRIHIGAMGEYFIIRIRFSKWQLAPRKVECEIEPLDKCWFDGSPTEVERAKRFLRREFKRSQKEADKPDYGAVRGVLTDAPVECKSAKFVPESGEYVCEFSLHFEPGCAALCFPCILSWKSWGDGFWECDLRECIGDTPEERRPTEQRLVAAFLERLQEAAIIEDEVRDAKWCRQLIHDYRAQVRRSNGETIVVPEARAAVRRMSGGRSAGNEVVQ